MIFGGFWSESALREQEFYDQIQGNMLISLPDNRWLLKGSGRSGITARKVKAKNRASAYTLSPESEGEKNHAFQTRSASMCAKNWTYSENFRFSRDPLGQ